MKPKKIAAFITLLRVANLLLSLMILSLWISGCTSLQISELAKAAKPPNISLGSVHVQNINGQGASSPGSIRFRPCNRQFE